MFTSVKLKLTVNSQIIVYNKLINKNILSIYLLFLLFIMKRSFRLIKNKYFLSILILLVILIAFEDTNLYRQFKSLNKLSVLQEVNDLKRIEIEEIKVKINELTTNPEELEKFARETYRMKKANEVIFLFVEENKQ